MDCTGRDSKALVCIASSVLMLEKNEVHASMRDRYVVNHCRGPGLTFRGSLLQRFRSRQLDVRLPKNWRGPGKWLSGGAPSNPLYCHVPYASRHPFLYGTEPAEGLASRIHTPAFTIFTISGYRGRECKRKLSTFLPLRLL